VSSEPNFDPRAPHNLVRFGGIEVYVLRRMGDPGFVYRALGEATMGAIA
jgi:hypothetical protein